MQKQLDFGQGDDVAILREHLFRYCPPGLRLERPDPMDQLVGSIISSLTRDTISLNAFVRLKSCFLGWPALAKADETVVCAAIQDVTYPEKKAAQLR